MIHVQSCCFAFDVLVAIASLDRKVPSLAGKRDSRRREKRKLYSGALAREARQRSTMGKKIW